MPPTGAAASTSTTDVVPKPGLTFIPAEEEPKEADGMARIREMREALDRGENPLAALAEEPEDEGADEGGEGEPEAEAEGAPEEPKAAEEEEEEEETEEPEEDGGQVEVVELPAFRDGQEPLPIEVSDPDAAERLRALINNGMRREDYKRQMAAVEADRTELNFITSSLESDPVNFMAEHVKPDLRVQLARYLLATASEEDYAAITEQADDWASDPRERELAALKLDRERRKRQEEAVAVRRQEQEQQERAAAVVGAIQELVPDSFDEQQGNRFYRIAVDEIKDYARTHRLTTLEPERVPVILEKAGILRMFGIKADAAKTAPGSASRARAETPAAGKPAAAPTDAKARAKAGEERMKKRAAARRAATAVAPTGSGAAPQRTQPPRGQTGKERLAWLKENPDAITRS
jgi:hypothetical protein